MMALDHVTPVDRMARRPSPARQIETRALVQGTCLVLLEAAGFAMNILLTVLGLPLFVFLLVAGWDLRLLFAQLGNLADHYRYAEPVARHLFSQDLKIAFLFAAGGYALLRLPAFLRRLERRLAEGDRRHD